MIPHGSVDFLRHMQPTLMVQKFTCRGDAMTASQYSLLAASIFGLVAILQIGRAATGLTVTIRRTSIPIWVSWLAGAVAALLAWLGYSASHM